MEKSLEVKATEEEQFFTDEMHKEIYLFQTPIGMRGFGGDKPIIKAVVIKSGKK